MESAYCDVGGKVGRRLPAWWIWVRPMRDGDIYRHSDAGNAYYWNNILDCWYPQCLMREIVPRSATVLRNALPVLVSYVPVIRWLVSCKFLVAIARAMFRVPTSRLIVLPILAGWVNPFYMVRYTFISTTHRNPSNCFGIYNSVIFLVLFVHRVT